MQRWEYEGETFLQFGLVQIAKNSRLCAPGKAWADPPQYAAAVEEWLTEHPSCKKWDPGVFGPPGFRFSSDELADEFLKKFG
jgi:hypothetical protein